MDQWIRESLRDTTAIGGDFTLAQILMALGLSFFLSLLLAYTYRVTHKGLSYSTSFVQTMIIMGVTVAIIMVIIGSNIARAFALVGALSIIRFRTAVKDPRDVAFIFMTMAVGMACGTGFFFPALVFALFACAMVYLMARFQVGAMSNAEMMLRVHLPEKLDYHQVFNEIFYKFLRDHSLLSVETIQGGMFLELVYAIQFKHRGQESAFMDEVRAVNGNAKIALITGQQNIDV